ncbi:MAG: 1,3-1,4-beta-glycanase, partial [Paracoccaceae bacterium]
MTARIGRIAARLLHFTMALHCSMTSSQAQEAEISETAFHEQFESFNRDFWFSSDGWNNGPHQNCDWSERAVDLAGGILRLSFLPGSDGMSKDHFCGEIQTTAICHFSTYEARIRTAKGSCLNAAYFTYTGPVHDAPHDE